MVHFPSKLQMFPSKSENFPGMRLPNSTFFPCMCNPTLQKQFNKQDSFQCSQDIQISTPVWISVVIQSQYSRNINQIMDLHFTTRDVVCIYDPNQSGSVAS